jgi:hypothetical protein
MSTIGYIDSDEFITNLKLYLNDENKDLTAAETAIALVQLQNAYNLIFEKLSTMGVAATDIPSWSRGREFQEAQAIYFCMLIFGRDREDKDLKGYITALDKRKELDELASVVLDDGTVVEMSSDDNSFISFDVAEFDTDIEGYI